MTITGVNDRVAVSYTHLAKMENLSGIFNWCLEGYKKFCQQGLCLLYTSTYDPDADCPRWHSFIQEVMCGDKDLADFLQRSLGYALTLSLIHI